jgi:hypothetical protein
VAFTPDDALPFAAIELSGRCHVTSPNVLEMCWNNECVSSTE